MFSYMKQGKRFYHEVVALAIPIILQNLITNSLSLLDTFMVGALGEAPMAAVTLANIPIFVIQLMTREPSTRCWASDSLWREFLP